MGVFREVLMSAWVSSFSEERCIDVDNIDRNITAITEMERFVLKGRQSH